MEILINKVFHVFDQADVGKHLVSIGRKEGRHWLRFPGLSGPLARIKLLDYGWNRFLFMFMSGLPTFSGLTLHIHGGHISRWFSRSKNRVVLHVHGSEIRAFDGDGKTVLSIDQETRDGIENADRVVYSTPDLGGLVKSIREDATWIPNPISPEALIVKRVNTPSSDLSIDVFFPHAWSHAKGINNVFALMKELRVKPGGDKLVFAGIALGPNQKLALDHGVKLFPPCARADLIKIMLQSRLVLGQGFGIIAMTDLEAIASKSNFLLFPLENQTRQAYGFTVDNQPTPSIKDLEEVAASFVFDSQEQPSRRGFDEILKKHSPKSILAKLNSVYEGPGL